MKANYKRKERKLTQQERKQLWEELLKYLREQRTKQKEEGKCNDTTREIRKDT